MEAAGAGGDMDGLTGRALWRALNKEKTVCPSCQKTLSRRALRWKHACGRPRARVDLDLKRAVLDQRAAEGFRARADLAASPTLEKADVDR
jgi:hypothetical protein